MNNIGERRFFHVEYRMLGEIEWQRYSLTGWRNYSIAVDIYRFGVENNDMEGNEYRELRIVDHKGRDCTP